jgi:hypothetical protein
MTTFRQLVEGRSAALLERESRLQSHLSDLAQAWEKYQADDELLSQLISNMYDAAGRGDLTSIYGDVTQAHQAQTEKLRKAIEEFDAPAGEVNDLRRVKREIERVEGFVARSIMSRRQDMDDFSPARVEIEQWLTGAGLERFRVGDIYKAFDASFPRPMIREAIDSLIQDGILSRNRGWLTYNPPEEPEAGEGTPVGPEPSPEQPDLAHGVAQPEMDYGDGIISAPERDALMMGEEPPNPIEQYNQGQIGKEELARFLGLDPDRMIMHDSLSFQDMIALHEEDPDKPRRREKVRIGDEEVLLSPEEYERDIEQIRRRLPGTRQAKTVTREVEPETELHTPQSGVRRRAFRAPKKEKPGKAKKLRAPEHGAYRGFEQRVAQAMEQDPGSPERAQRDVHEPEEWSQIGPVLPPKRAIAGAGDVDRGLVSNILRFFGSKKQRKADVEKTRAGKQQSRELADILTVYRGAKEDGDQAVLDWLKRTYGDLEQHLAGDPENRLDHLLTIPPEERTDDQEAEIKQLKQQQVGELPGEDGRPAVELSDGPEIRTKEEMKDALGLLVGNAVGQDLSDKQVDQLNGAVRTWAKEVRKSDLSPDEVMDSFKDTVNRWARKALDTEVFLESLHESLDEWKHQEPKAYVDQLSQAFGPPDVLASDRAVWVGKMPGLLEVEVKDEWIAHAHPRPHHDFVYATREMKVPPEVVDDLAKVSGSIIVDGLADTVTARCGSLLANAVTLDFVEDVAKGQIPRPKMKAEYRKRIMANEAPPWWRKGQEVLNEGIFQRVRDAWKRRRMSDYDRGFANGQQAARDAMKSVIRATSPEAKHRLIQSILLADVYSAQNGVGVFSRAAPKYVSGFVSGLRDVATAAGFDVSDAAVERGYSAGQVAMRRRR